MLQAPNTPSNLITRDGPYHMVSPVKFGLGASTVANAAMTGPARCRNCKQVAAPAHCRNGAGEDMQVYCGKCCPNCIVFRKYNS